MVVKVRNSKIIGRIFGGLVSFCDNYFFVRGKFRLYVFDSLYELGFSLVSRDGVVKVGMGVDGVVVGFIV